MIDCTREAALKAGRKYKSEAMNVVAESLKDASIAQLRNLHSEARLRFDTASTEDDALSSALFMQQIRYEVWKRTRQPDESRVTPVYIRKEAVQWN